jgi:hypothetical protein
MGFSARAGLLGLCLVGVATPLAARAQPSDSATAEAKKHFDIGLEHYKAGRFAEALKEFQQANTIAPRESLQRNVAQTQRDLRDYASAYESYEKLLKSYGSGMKAEDRSAAEKALQELSTLTGEIAFFINVPNAMVIVDDKERGEPPTTVRANVGSHRVQVRAPGYQPIDKQVDLKGKDKVAINGPLLEAGLEPALPPVNVPAPSTVEPPPASSTAELEKWVGLYARIELSGMFPTAHHDSVSDGDVYGRAVPVKGSGLYGGGMGVHVGYSFGHFGIEGFVTGAYDHGSVTADLGTRKDDWNFYRGGGVVGAAFRYTPHFDELGPIRPTAGLGVGLAGRAVGYQRLIEDTTSKDKASFQFYMAPSLMADVGFLIGQTPGAKFYLGLMAILEFPGGIELPSGNSKDGKFPIPAGAKVEAANGVEFFLGPSLGLAFGH